MEKIKVSDVSVQVTVNTKVYPIEIIYSAAYSRLDELYVFLDGDPTKEITVSLTPKEKPAIPLERIGQEFANDLINYADYRVRAKESRKIREMLLQRALFTNDPSSFSPAKEDFDEDEFNKLMEELDKEELEDPEGIAIPWEEKYGKEDSPKK